MAGYVTTDRMAAWCRKCIYLQPKFEKLAADIICHDHFGLNRVKFYCVDVNNVPQTTGNISLWSDGEMKAVEVIGGHEAWIVIEEVKQMIQQLV